MTARPRDFECSDARDREGERDSDEPTAWRLASGRGQRGSAILQPCFVPDEDREHVIELAEVLDDFNNGLIGPGHCDDVLGDD